MSLKNGPDGWRAKRHRLREFLAEHFGVVTTDELHEMGFSPSGIHDLVHVDRELVRCYRGVYRGTAVPLSHEGLLRCELMRAGTDAVLARRTAAHHLGFLDWAPEKVQLFLPRAYGFSEDPVADKRGRPNLAAHEIHQPRGLRCTTPERLVVDLAADVAASTSHDRDLRVLKRVSRAAALQDSTLVDRWRTLAKGSFPGAPVLRRELFAGFERTLDVRSDPEVDFVDLCRRFGLPIPITNATVHGFLLDNWFPDHKAFVEVNVYGTHKDAISFERDLVKIPALRRLGIAGLAVSDRRMAAEPAVVADDVRRVLRLN